MPLPVLRLFRDIVTTKSLSRGAELSGITPSAASQRLAELEREMGAELLDRSTRPLLLTPAGKAYFDFCRDVLRREESLLADLDKLKGEVEGTVRVAAIYSVGLSEMAHLEEEFSRRAPRGRLEVEYLRPERVYERVKSDLVDLGLVSYPEATRDIAVIDWREEQMVVAAAPSHPLAKRRKLHTRDLSGIDFIAFDEDLPIRREIDRYLRAHGVEVNVALHFDNLQTIKEAVRLGTGVSIVPLAIIREEVREGSLVALPLADGELVRPVGIIHRKRKRFQRVAQVFLDVLQEVALETAAAAVTR